MNEEQLDRSKLSDRTVDFLKEQILTNVQCHEDASNRLAESARRNIIALIVSGSALIGFGTGSDTALSFAALAMGLHLVSCVWLLIGRGMQVGNFPALGNEPNLLLGDEFLAYPEAEIILAELAGKQESIIEMRTLNEKKGTIINNALQKALLSPLTFAITFLLSVLAGQAAA